MWHAIVDVCVQTRSSEVFTQLQNVDKLTVMVKSLQAFVKKKKKKKKKNL